MNITSKIIITDTNIITDLNNAKVLDKFIELDNVFVSDLVKNDEFNCKTCDIEIINKMKVISLTDNQLLEITNFYGTNSSLSKYDYVNFVAARDNNGILATGDNKLKLYAEQNGVEVIRTLKIIRLMQKKSIISSSEAINACANLKNDKNTRIPIEEIDNLIEELKKNLMLN